MPLVYATLAAAFGGESVMLAKIVIELIKTTVLEMDNAFAHWEMYLMIVCLLTSLWTRRRFLKVIRFPTSWTTEAH